MTGWLDLFAPRVLFESLPGGVDVRDFNLDLVDFKYKRSVRKIDKATITLSNVDLKYANDSRFDREIRLRVRWGYPGGLSSVKDMVVTQVAPNLGAGVPQLVMTALDSGQNLATVGSRNWGSVQSSDIAHAIARRHSLQTDIVASGDRRNEHRVQTGATTDYEFLARLADRINFDFWVDGQTLHYRPVDTSALPRHRFVYYIDGSSTLKSFHPTVKKGKLHRRHVGGVSQAGSPSVETPRRAPTERGLGSHYVFGINTPAARAGVIENPDNQVAVTPSPETSPTIRARHASAAQHQAEMDAAHMQIELVGNPTLEIRDVIDIFVIERRYSGLWRIEELEDHYGSHGYSTSGKVKRAETNAAPTVVSGSQVPTNERNQGLTPGGTQDVTMFGINNRTSTATGPTVVRRRAPVIAR